jgi:hypothetical protein
VKVDSQMQKLVYAPKHASPMIQSAGSGEVEGEWEWVENGWMRAQWRKNVWDEKLQNGPAAHVLRCLHYDPCWL